MAAEARYTEQCANSMFTVHLNALCQPEQASPESVDWAWLSDQQPDPTPRQETVRTKGLVARKVDGVVKIFDSKSGEEVLDIAKHQAAYADEENIDLTKAVVARCGVNEDMRSDEGRLQRKLAKKAALEASETPACRVIPCRAAVPTVPTGMGSMGCAIDLMVL